MENETVRTNVNQPNLTKPKLEIENLIDSN